MAVVDAFQVHKLVLQVSSTEFASLLEPRCDAIKKGYVVLSASADAVEAFLVYLYEGRLTHQCLSDVALIKEVFELASK